ncbi:hypothetical protein AB0J83_40930 [Actinoplanes sp. NPDC049596]|uniref:hypothetical protein n=1 Tax=unclassified Actinoplanes TaxID=2626549 RepID=UPI00342B8817
MTELGVGRTRTACPLPSVPPAGDSSPVPPHIQGAEWRTESRARRHTGSRWGLRVLVVGGLAGAAWLLTGAAAHAADRVDGPDGSLLGSVIGADTTTPVTDLLQAAVEPLEAERPDHERHMTDILDVPRRVLSHPAETVDEVTQQDDGTPVDDAVSDVDQVLSDVTGTIRLIGGPETPQRLAAVTDAITETESPAGDRPEPSTADRQPEPRPVSAITASPVTSTKTFRAANAGHHAVVAVKHGKVSSTKSARRHHHHARAAQAAKVGGPEKVEGDSTPGGDEPAAPVRLRLGDVSGTPTSGSGTPTEGGSAAFLPAAIVSSTMASHLAAIASDVEARQHDAEAPTVSPD